MLCRYEITVRAICPIHKVPDTYQVTVESPHEVMVETILDIAHEMAGTEQTQERITETLAKRLPGCTITSIGYHSGVRTTVIVP